MIRTSPAWHETQLQDVVNNPRSCKVLVSVGRLLKLAAKHQDLVPTDGELAEGVAEVPEGLQQRMKEEIRSRLLVTTDIRFSPFGTLPRETYKIKLVDFSDADEPVAAQG